MCYLPPYEREIWHYQRANVDQIQWAIEQLSWEKSLRNLIINEMVSLFNRTISNILSNYIPDETIICDDKNLLWFNNNIKQLIQEKNNIYKSYVLGKKILKFSIGWKVAKTSLHVQLKVTKKSIICVYSKNWWIQSLVQ